MKAKRKAHQKGKTARRRKTTRRLADLHSIMAKVPQLTLDDLKALGQAPENK